MAALDANAQPKPSATLIVTNAAVYTVDKQQPKAEAVAVIGDRIVAVGSRADIDLWRGPQTKVIDAGGKLLLPGFNDAKAAHSSTKFSLLMPQPRRSSQNASRAR